MRGGERWLSRIEIFSRGLPIRFPQCRCREPQNRMLAALQAQALSVDGIESCGDSQGTVGEAWALLRHSRPGRPGSCPNHPCGARSSQEGPHSLIVWRGVRPGSVCLVVLGRTRESTFVRRRGLRAQTMSVRQIIRDRVFTGLRQAARETLDGFAMRRRHQASLKTAKRFPIPSEMKLNAACGADRDP